MKTEIARQEYYPNTQIMSSKKKLYFWYFNRISKENARKFIKENTKYQPNDLCPPTKGL